MPTDTSAGWIFSKERLRPFRRFYAGQRGRPSLDTRESRRDRFGSRKLIGFKRVMEAVLLDTAFRRYAMHLKRAELDGVDEGQKLCLFCLGEEVRPKN